MTIANWCIAAACMLPAAVALMPKVASMAGKDRYDNHLPREWAQRQTGSGKRAIAAQLNGFEALPLFIAAVILAQNAHVDQGRIDMLALAFLGIRIIYSLLYLANLGTMRTLVWFSGVGICVAMIAMA
jgi:uncharacterized MAPEG superfamily protein